MLKVNKRIDIKVMMERLDLYISDKGMRTTSERRIVLENVFKQDSEFSVLDVFLDLIDSGTSMQTVYNCFKIYLSAGIIIQIPSLGNERIYKISHE